ncbi:putative protein with phoX homologous domain, present in p47phox and p40phox [Lyophyllum shimeji]|uniref:PX domain-containing protein n=1 Tax=Lyophyllum shimeji TaxID=47721 RepID=A0A9P3URU0_LYOSH|nr:putative protein with phoX homologous domain, present in p47phox and p40phox [Lyophyllum shimeji]
MDTFEDENPFDQGTENISSETSSNSKVDLSAPSSPPFATRQLPPSSPLSRPFPSPGSHRQPQTRSKSDFCCARDRYLHSGEDVEILITDAQKTSQNSSSPYIAYVIRTGTAEARHRYSEFESLRDNLVKLYPTLILPPIPSKQTLGDYAVKQGKAKEDAAMIARRKRMLQTFLNRVARHPILSNEHVFHRFLDGEVSWTEVLNSPPISLLPKNILKAPSHNPTDQNASPAYNALPNPSAAHPLRHPDQRFLDSEVFTNKFANHVSGPMEKVTRRVIKRWSDYAQDHADLGAALNGFSLNETGALSGAIEKTGQAADSTYMSTSKLLQELEQNWAEPLHEYSQFASIIKKLLAYRHQKHVQYEMTQDGLESKREQLEELEKSEREARRLEEALGRGRVNGSQTTPSASEDVENREGSETQEGEEGTSPSSSYLPPHPGPNPARRRPKPPGMGFLNALSYTLHGMMDVDPETARRNSITKTRETISQLEDALHLSAQDLKYSSSTIQADLDRFQRQKVADLREMSISMARSHRDWCKKNLEAWEEAKKEIDKIPDHPNHSQESKAEGVGPSGGILLATLTYILINWGQFAINISPDLRTCTAKLEVHRLFLSVISFVRPSPGEAYAVTLVPQGSALPTPVLTSASLKLTDSRYTAFDGTSSLKLPSMRPCLRDSSGSSKTGCNRVGQQHFPSLLTPEHVSVLCARANAFSLDADATPPPTTISKDELLAKLSFIAKQAFSDKYGYAYAESESLPPDMAPDASSRTRTLKGFVAIPLDNVEQARICSEQVLKSMDGNPQWFVAQFIKDIAVRAQEVFNVSDPDRWAKSALKSTYGDPEDSNDRVEVRTVYLYTNIVSSDGAEHSVVYYLGIYYSTKPAV